MALVKMIKGSKLADIAEEMVESAKKDGYTVYAEAPKPQAEPKVEKKVVTENTTETTEVKIPTRTKR